MKKKTILQLISCAFLVLPLSGCKTGLKGLTEEPKVRLDHVYTNKVDFSGAHLMFVLEVENPNPVDIKIDELDYSISLFNKKFADGKAAEGLKVPARSKANIELPLPVKFDQLFNNFADALSASEVPFKVEGQAKSGWFKFPFAKEGSVKIK